MARTTAARDRRWQNAEVVRERDDSQLRSLWRLLAGALAAASPLVVYLVMQMDYVQTRYRIEALRERQEALVDTEQRLRIERATLQTLPDVEEAARRNPELTRVPPEARIVVESPVGRQGSR